MKKLILALSVLAFTMTAMRVQAQFYRSYAAEIVFEGEKHKVEDEALVLFDTETKAIYVQHSTISFQYFFIDDPVLLQEGVDAEGDVFVVIGIQAIDDKQLKCYLYIMTWPGLPFLHFRVEYNNLIRYYATIRIQRI